MTFTSSYASSGIILKDKKILLIKRDSNTKVYPNTWACPGGKQDEGETPKQTSTREIKEEINLDFKPTKLFSTGKYKSWDLHRFLGEWSGEIIAKEDEVSEYNWFSYENAIKLDLAFDYKEVIEMLHDGGFI